MPLAPTQADRPARSAKQNTAVLRYQRNRAAPKPGSLRHYSSPPAHTPRSSLADPPMARGQQPPQIRLCSSRLPRSYVSRTKPLLRKRRDIGIQPLLPSLRSEFRSLNRILPGDSLGEARITNAAGVSDVYGGDCTSPMPIFSNAVSRQRARWEGLLPPVVAGI